MKIFAEKTGVADIEKVIKGLKSHMSVGCQRCPYQSYGNKCMTTMLKECTDLLENDVHTYNLEGNRNENN